MVPAAFTVGSLYVAGFTQARAPHLGLLIATSTSNGRLFHIRIDRTSAPHWQYQCRTQVIDRDMFLSSLLRVHDASLGAIDEAQVQAAATDVPPPENDTFGECGPWVYRVLGRLEEGGLLKVRDVAALAKEVEEFAVGSRAHARRDKFPNVAASQYCF